MATAKLLLLISFISVFVSCQSSPKREPNIASIEFDASKTILLKWAAQERILFQMSDSVFQDVQETRVSSTCKKLENPAWSEAVYKTLSTLKRNPNLHGKVHVLEIKSSDQPYISTSQDLDGLNYLIVAYAKKEKTLQVADGDIIPCDEKLSSYLNQNKTVVEFTYPSSYQIENAVKNISSKGTPERWKFKTGFLSHLATRLTVFRVNPELNFEKNAKGQSFLASFLNEQSDLIAKQNYKTFEYWLNELSLRSHSASYLKIFSLVKDKDLNYGMGSVPNSYGLSYPFLTYTVTDGHYTYPSLSQLDRCLNDLSSRYKRSLASINSDISTQSNNFLFPGYTCR